MKKWTWFRSGARLLVLVLATSISIFNLVPVAAGDVDDLVVQGLGPDDPIPPRHIYAVTQDGRLLVYVDNSSDTAANWIAQAVATPALQGINWATFTQIFAGGDGILYAIDAGGRLHYFRLLDPWRNAVQMRWSADSNTIIGGPGWNGIPAVGFSRLAFGQGQTGQASSSLVRAIWSTNGAFYQHGWKANGLVEPDFLKWTLQGNGRQAAYYGPALPGPYTGSGYETFEGGGGITYAIDGSGNLLRFHIHPDGQWVNPSGQLVGDAAAQPLQIDTKWSNFLFVTASPGEYSIEGYVSTAQPVPNTSSTIAPMSVAPGATVKVRASTFSPSYTVRLLRLERHTQDDTGTPSGLIDGMKIGRTMTLRAPAGGNFKKPENFNMYTSGAGWGSDGADIDLPMGAQPGIYAAELTTPSGGRYLAPFVVKPRGGKPAKNIAVIANVSTWNAYNQWGGSSRYFSWVHPELQDTAGQPPIDLSYERPLLESPPNDGAIPAVGLINRDPRAANHLVRAEVWVNTWLDSLAAVDPKYAYDVYSDIDLNQGIANLAQHKLLILTTHPEYWSDNMRTNLEAYLNSGGHLIYMAGNGLYDRVTITDAGNMRLQRGLGGNCPGGVNGANPCPPRDLLDFIGNSVYSVYAKL